MHNTKHALLSATACGTCRRKSEYQLCVLKGMFPQFIRHLISVTIMEQHRAVRWLADGNAGSGPPPFDMAMYDVILKDLQDQAQSWGETGLPELAFPESFIAKAQRTRRSNAEAPAPAEAKAAKSTWAATETKEGTIRSSSHTPAVTQSTVSLAGTPAAVPGCAQGVADMDELDCEPHACAELRPAGPALDDAGAARLDVLDSTSKRCLSPTGDQNSGQIWKQQRVVGTSSSWMLRKQEG
jgi:hypothetical protein